MTNMNTLGGEENMDEKRKKLEYIKDPKVVKTFE